MGNLLVNGIDVNHFIGELYDNSDKRIKASEVIGTKLKGFNPNIDAQLRKAVIGDTCDVFNERVKHNGSIITVAPVGTRPMNETETRVSGDNFTKYLVNKNGLLIISDSNPEEVGIDEIGGLLPNENRGVKSTDKNKKIVVTLAMWGAGGRGGGGAYFTIFMGPAGNYGGVGGSGGGKAFVKLELENNAYCKIRATTNNFVGRYTSNEEYTYPASPCILNCYGVDVLTCYGGRSGVSCSRHTRFDNEVESNCMVSGGEPVLNYYPGIFKGGITLTLCMRAMGGNKVDTGYSGKSSIFEARSFLQYGNPENVQGLVALTGNGGRGYGRGDSRGSGGGGSYGNGGDGGDMGNGSGGASGNAGGGGGGAGSPAGGADGGVGGYAGFSVFY